MRKLLETIGLSALALTAWITWQALDGPTPLPDRIATHFDAAGNPNGWSSPSALLFLPAMGVALYLLMTAVARFPAVFNYPVAVTAENRPRLEALALGMIAWIKMEMVCLFAWIQWSTIEVARHGQGGLPPALLPASLVAIFGTLAWFIVAMRHATHAGSGS